MVIKIQNQNLKDYTKIFQDALDKKENNLIINIEDGIYPLGSISINSNTTINLSKNTILVFLKQKELYRIEPSNFEGEERFRLSSMIKIDNSENVEINGGIIDGNGHLWRYIKDFKLNKKEIEELVENNYYTLKTKEGNIYYPTKTMYEGALIGEENIKDKDLYYDLFLPVMLHIGNSKNVRIKNTVLTNSPIWNTHIIFSTNVTIENCFFKNPDYGQSTDALDIESCKDVTVTNCSFDCGDDAICLKAGKGIKALEKKIPCENITITNNTIYKAHGGIVIGSETARGIRNIHVKDIRFIETEIGLRFKSSKGRCGVIENVFLDNLFMHNIKKEAVLFDTSYVLYKLNEKPDIKQEVTKEELPIFKNFYISNLKCSMSKVAIKINGLEDALIHDISFNNCRFNSKNENIVKNAYNIFFSNVFINDVEVK